MTLLTCDYCQKEFDNLAESVLHQKKCHFGIIKKKEPQKMKNEITDSSIERSDIDPAFSIASVFKPYLNDKRSLIAIAAAILLIFSTTLYDANVDSIGFSLKSIGDYDTDGYARGVTISGNYAYVADGDDGLVILNIEDPANPTLVGSYDTDGYVYSVTISGNYAYVADSGNGLVIINIEDPANPTLTGSSDTDGFAYDVTISGNYAYVADGDVLLVLTETSILGTIIIISSSAICFGYLYWRYSFVTTKVKIHEAKRNLKTQIARLKEKGIRTDEFEEIIKKLEN